MKSTHFNKRLSLMMVLALLITMIPMQSAFAVPAVNQALLDNGKLKFGSDAATTSISTYGSLDAPRYKNASNIWEDLTLSQRRLGFLVEEGGDGTNQWNANGNFGYADDSTSTLAITGLTVNVDGYDSVTKTGVVKTTANASVGGKAIQIDNEYTLLANKSYLKVKTKITNISGSDMTNVRYIAYARDDYIGTTDSPDKAKGNIENGAFVQAPTAGTQSKALKVFSGTSTVVFYSTEESANVVISGRSGSSVKAQDPSTVATTRTTTDEAYGMYFRLDNLANNASDEVTWYYAAGAIENLADIIADVGNAQAPTNQAYLEDLTIQNGTLSPSFTTGGALYTTVLPVGTTTANITPTASGSSITINGSAVTSTSTAAISVTPGHNAVRVEVTSGSAVKTVDLDIVVASNLLSALTLGSGTLTPTFDSGTTAYTVSYAVGTTGTTVAATTLTTGASVTINGTATSSAAITLSAGTNTINVVVTAEDSTTKSYTITATVASPASNEDKGTTTPSTPTATPTTNPGADVIVNGIKASAGQENTTVVGGRLVKELVVNSKTIDTMIDQALKAISDAKANNTTVTTTNIVRIPVTNTTSDIITVKLTGDIVKRLDDNKFSINIETNKGNFILPAQEMKISEIAKSFNLATDLQKIVVDVQINVSLPAVTEMLNNAVKANGNMVVVSQPLEFKITASSSETKETVEISKFTSYVEREVLLPSTVDMTKITTGVLIEPNGQLRHIPTKVFTLNNNNYANIQSLTNSDYSVVYNPVKVASVEGHWAQTAVNDLASRLIISEPAKFEPNAKITRGEFATMLTKALGLYRTEGPKLTFKDVKDTDPNAVGIAFAAEYKLISGYSDGNFKPDQQISRQEAMVIFTKAMTLVGIQQDAKAKLAPYADASQVASWAKDAATTVTNANVMSGIGANKLGPKMTFTAAEAAYAVRNMLVSGDMINK